jgi:ligand-binding sensor domain-containing protein
VVRHYSKGCGSLDGTTLTYFSTKSGLCENTVASIREDHGRNIWFGTRNGASKYDGKTFTCYGEAEGLHGADCEFIVDRKGNIWTGTNPGVFRFNGSSFIKFELTNPPVENLSYK